MSQAVGQVASQPPRQNEFEYRPVPAIAPVSLVLGVCSGIGLLTAFGVALALVATIVSTIAFVKIRRSQGEYGGMFLATAGLVLSTGFFVSGTAWHSYAYATEVPEGHRRVNFTNDISRKQFVVANGQRKLHPDVEPLVGRKIFIKGYVWSTRQQTDLKSFVLLKDNGKCCFGGNPKPWDMIFVQMDEPVDYKTGLVSVAGILRADPNAGYGQPVYTIEGTHYERARTSF